jgi:anti-sigma factor RsiW
VTCTDFLSQLTDYFDGQIDPRLLAEVQAHICECHHCEVVLDTTRQTIAIYREQEVYEFPSDLQDRLHSAIMTKCMASKRDQSTK